MRWKGSYSQWIMCHSLFLMKRNGCCLTYAGVPGRSSDSRLAHKRIGRHRRPIRLREFVGTFAEFKAASLASDAKYKIFLFAQNTFDFQTAEQFQPVAPVPPDNHIHVPSAAFSHDLDTVFEYYNPHVRCLGWRAQLQHTWTAKNTDLLEECVSNVHEVLEEDDTIDEVVYYKPDLLWDEDETSEETFHFFLKRLAWFNVDYRRQHLFRI